MLGINDDETVDVHASGRKMRVAVQPELQDQLERAKRSCSTNRSTSCWSGEPERTGEIATVKEVLGDGERAMIVGRADENRVVELGDALLDSPGCAPVTRPLDARAGIILGTPPRPEVEDLVLEEVPDVSYNDVGGLDDQIEQITDAVELPFVHQATVQRVRPARPEGHPALRPARLRQDPYRQGGRQQPRQEGERGLRRR